MELFAEYRAKEKLLDQLDQSLLNHAKSLSAGEGPGIADVYHLQSLAELHCYLKTVHQFDSAEVEALLKFADPLAAANLCWEENPHEYSFPIRELLKESNAYERLPLAEPTPPPEKASVRERLRTAIQEANRQAAQGHDRSGDVR